MTSAPLDVPGMASGAVALAGGWSFNCALLADGSEKCWGSNGMGQLGIGSSDSNSHYYHLQ